MAIGGTRREQQEFDNTKKIGMFSCKVLAINPTIEQYKDLYSKIGIDVIPVVTSMSEIEQQPAVMDTNPMKQRNDDHQHSEKNKEKHHKKEKHSNRQYKLNEGK